MIFFFSNEFGYIQPSGLILAGEGKNQTYLIWSKPGAFITGILLDGIQQPIPGNSSRYTYTLYNIISDHTIEVEHQAMEKVVIASLSLNLSSGSAPLTVAFNDTSSGNPDTWNWKFGDGNVSTLQNPVYTYSAPGRYDVSLLVRNADASGTGNLSFLFCLYLENFKKKPY